MLKIANSENIIDDEGHWQIDIIDLRAMIEHMCLRRVLDRRVSDSTGENQLSACILDPK